MKIYAVSDIHGYFEEFECALSKVDLSGENKLILLGDYIHGPDGYAVMDKIIAMQEEYGENKVIALRGNHEAFAIEGSWPIGEDRFGYFNKTSTHDDAYYLKWMKKLPFYYVIKNTIFVHAGIDEEAAADWSWEIGTGEDIFVSKYPAETGQIENFDMKIVAGHVGTSQISGDSFYHDIFHDGGSHYYIDGTVDVSGKIPVLIYDTEKDKYYRITDEGEWLILPYDQEK